MQSTSRARTKLLPKSVSCLCVKVRQYPSCVRMPSAPEITFTAQTQAKSSIDVLAKVFEKKKSLFQVVWIDGSCQKDFAAGSSAGWSFGLGSTSHDGVSVALFCEFLPCSNECAFEVPVL